MNDLTLTVATITANLSDTQKAARDLYERGLNVIPLPTVYEWRARPEFEKDPNKKPPYLVHPFYYTRLHLCAPECNHVTYRKAKGQTIRGTNLKAHEYFDALFERANIGVMMGRTSGNLLAIDCDSQKAFQDMRAELERRKIPYWAISSHRGGAYLLRVIEGEIANKPKVKDVEVFGNQHYVVLPPSIHPQGTVYTWMTPDPCESLPRGVSIPPVSVTSLDWLGLTLRRNQNKWQEPELFDLPAWTVCLSRANRETLAKGAMDGQRNSKLTAAAYDMAGNDIPKREAESILLQSAARCIPEYSERDALAILRSAYKKKNVTPARKSNTLMPIVKAWQRAESFALSFDWRTKYKRKARTYKQIFLACIERAKLDGGEVFRASGRELADMMGRAYSYKRIAMPIHTLIKDGYLSRAGTSQSDANLYRFGMWVKMPPVISPCSNSGGILTYQNMPKTDAEKDVLGRYANDWQVWRYLLVIPCRTEYAIAKALKISKSSVRTSVRRLQAWGLIVYSQSEHEYYAEPVTDSTLARLAESLNKDGESKTVKRRAKHKQEREIRANVQTARARMFYKQGNH